MDHDLKYDGIWQTLMNKTGMTISVSAAKTVLLLTSFKYGTRRANVHVVSSVKDFLSAFSSCLSLKQMTMSVLANGTTHRR